MQQIIFNDYRNNITKVCQIYLEIWKLGSFKCNKIMNGVLIKLDIAHYDQVYLNIETILIFFCDDHNKNFIFINFYI